MNCLGCIYADWERTANGRLHPNKQGRCTAIQGLSIPDLPAAYYWAGYGHRNVPTPYGGHIERGKELREPCSWRKEEEAA